MNRLLAPLAFAASLAVAQTPLNVIVQGVPSHSLGALLGYQSTGPDFIQLIGEGSASSAQPITYVLTVNYNDASASHSQSCTVAASAPVCFLPVPDISAITIVSALIQEAPITNSRWVFFRGSAVASHHTP